jgi:hypothetical protein
MMQGKYHNHALGALISNLITVLCHLFSGIPNHSIEVGESTTIKHAQRLKVASLPQNSLYLGQ